MIEKHRIDEIVRNYKPKNANIKRKVPKKSVQDELDEMLMAENHPDNLSSKHMGDIVEKYYKEKRPDLSLEAKASLQMVQSDSQVEQVSKKSLAKELIQEDIDNLPNAELMETHSGIFKSTFTD